MLPSSFLPSVLFQVLLLWTSRQRRVLGQVTRPAAAVTKINTMRPANVRRSCARRNCSAPDGAALRLSVGLRARATVLAVLLAVTECADLVAVAPGDGVYPEYKCPLDTLNLNLECNVREAILYLDPARSPDPSYNNIRLKTHDSDNPDFIYYWDQTRAVYVDYHVRISTGYPDFQYALIEGYDGPEHVEDEEAYYDAGFILVGEGGSVYIECVKFQHFNRLVLPALSIHSYPHLDTTISHGGVLSAHGGYLHLLACQFYNNSAKQGGAVYVTGGNKTNATVVQIASASIFTSNYAQYSGGAIYVEASTPVVVDIGTDRASSFYCSDYYNLYEPTTAGITLIEKDADCGVRFAGNRAGYYGGAVSIASDLPPTLDYTHEVTVHEYCEFAANEAGSDGGGLYMYFTPGVDIKRSVTFSSNEANAGGGLYGSRMLTFVLGEQCVFDNNYADDCGGGMYLNIAGCANPCQPGADDDSIRFTGNSAGNTQGTTASLRTASCPLCCVIMHLILSGANCASYSSANASTQGDCPVATVVDDNSFGTKNCSFVIGKNCTPTDSTVDTSYFPIDEQAAGLFTLDFQVNYNRFTVDETLEVFLWTCESTEAYGGLSSYVPISRPCCARGS